jgi:hypothetical protein
MSRHIFNALMECGELMVVQGLVGTDLSHWGW